MLAPRAPGAFVCLRCELKRARQWTAARSFSSARRLTASARETTSAPETAQDAGEAATSGSDHASTPSLDDPPAGPSNSHSNSHSNNHSISHSNNHSISHSFSLSNSHSNRLSSDNASDHPPVRITREYMRAGKITRQRKTRLGMSRLDEDAHILVLNEAPAPDEPAPPPDEPLEPIAVPDILSALQRDTAPATHEDVARQLDALRPSRRSSGSPDPDGSDGSHGPAGPFYVRTAEFVRLTAALTRGFTAAQLSAYYSTRKQLKRGAMYKAVKATLSATKRSEWHPSITSIEKRVPGIESVSKKPKKPVGIRKATLVDKILRDVWKLQLLEELEAPGELELRLHDWQPKLLQAGGSESNITRIAMLRNAKVEIHWRTNILRITADKTTAEYTANDVEEALRKTHTSTLDLSPWITLLELPEEQSLAASLPSDYVSSLTSTHVHATDTHTLTIHGLNETSVAEAQRLIIRLLPFKPSAIHSIDTQRLDAALNTSYLLPTFHESNTLDYAYRGLSLGRWAAPVPRIENTPPPQEQETSPNPTEPDSALPPGMNGVINQLISFMRPPPDGSFTRSESTPKRRKTSNWATEPEYKVSADFGQALFPLEYAHANQVVEAARKPARCPFQPAIPGLGKLLASSEFENLSRTEAPALLYDFIPAPTAQQDACKTEPDLTIGPDFPKLHIQVRTGRDGNKTTIHKLSLGFRERIHDVLLPDQAADVRFYRYGRLRFSAKSHHDEHVNAWTDAVRNNIESGGRLSAPPLTLQIPKWTIPGYPSTATGTVPITYLFSGIQFRQSVTGRLLDTQISYSTVQSGKLGAKGGVLSAYSPDINGDDCDALIRGFAGKCVQLVDYITQAGAQTQPLKQIRNPRNEHSARKQRRAARVEGQDLEQDDRSEQEREEDQLADHTSDPADPTTEIDPSNQTASASQNEIDAARLASRIDSDTASPSVAAADDAYTYDTDLDAADAAATDAADADAEDAQAIDSQAQTENATQRDEADALLRDLFGDDAMGKAEDGEGDDGEAVDGQSGSTKET